MKRAILAAALLVLPIIPPVSAEVPSTMSYQGVLTDGGGQIVPDGVYDLEFNIYDVAVAGAPLWTESHAAVPVSLGGFSVILGSISPLALPFDKQYWLGVKVNGNPELAPRIPLASSPYGLSLRLPFAGNASSTVPLVQLENAGTGPELALGSTSDDALLHAYISGAALPTLRLYNFGGKGTAIDFFDESGAATHYIEPDTDGDGGFLSVLNGNGFEGFVVDGKFGGGGNTRVIIDGTESQTTFNTNNSGDASVSLPSDAVSAAEVLDEPGISQGFIPNTPIDILDELNMTDVVTTTITIPADGYIFVTASAQHGMQSSAGTANRIALQIDETAGGGIDINRYYYSGYSADAPDDNVFVPVQIQRSYLKSAGTYTFRLEAIKVGSTGASWLWNPAITAMFIPTGYGPVTESAQPFETAAIGGAAPVQIAGGGRGAPDRAAVVDLRELELRAARLRAQAREAELELLKAQRGQSHDRRVWNAQSGN